MEEPAASALTWLDVLGLVVDAISLAAVLVALAWARKDRQQDRRLAARAFWVQELILGPNKEKLLDAFDGIEGCLRRAIERPAGDARDLVKSEVIHELGEHVRVLQDFVLRESYLVSKELGNALSSSVEMLQDDLLNGWEKSIGRSELDSTLFSVLRGHRRDFFSFLYDYLQDLGVEAEKCDSK